ncbi:MAG: hypothetical protein J5679_03100 [Alphaproteobacteria bacterium]|nr:hypothetical protein [Alphaproteobacteria bacterium]
MKTKIIYISGNELFDMADIRSAFEEVRTALSLGNDTVLFGVPVDNDDALETVQQTPDVVAPEIVEQEKPVRQQRARKSPKVVPIHPEIEPDIQNESAQIEPVIEPVVEPQPEETVIPILSVLETKTNESVEPEPVIEQDIVEIADDEPQEKIDDTITDAEPVTISDIITEDIPEATHEKTLEELLESMTPLGEDADQVVEQTQTIDVAESVDTDDQKPTEDDTDITLEKLATEFVENQDRIETPAKPTGRGKIGKLKNILPFKKAKHDDSGLMGDLFGWAGVAANDEDFTIPGFFK